MATAEVVVFTGGGPVGSEAEAVVHEPEVMSEADALAAEFDREYRALDGLARQTFEAGARLGRVLKRAKLALGHGQFRVWLKTATRISTRSASDYMRLADNYEAVTAAAAAKEQPAAHLTAKAALRMLAGPPRRRRERPGGGGDTTRADGPGEGGVGTGAADEANDQDGREVANPGGAAGRQGGVSVESDGPGTGRGDGRDGQDDANPVEGEGADGPRTASEAGADGESHGVGGDHYAAAEASESRAATDGTSPTGGEPPDPAAGAGTGPASPCEASAPGGDGSTGTNLAGRREPGVAWSGVTDPAEVEALDTIRVHFQAGLRLASATVRNSPDEPNRSRRMTNSIRPYLRQLVTLLDAVSPQAWAACDRCGGRGVTGGGSPCGACRATGMTVVE